jgi:probable lipoprotein NlpC
MSGFRCFLYKYLFVVPGLLFAASNLFAEVPLQNIASQTGTAREARLKVIAAAERYQGTPYRYGGVDARGLDCSGLVYLSFRDALAVSVPRTTGALDAWAEKIPVESLQPGDLLFFTTLGQGNKTKSHVGIYAGNNRFIHSASDGPKTGVMYSRLDESFWSRSYAGAGRALAP